MILLPLLLRRLPGLPHRHIPSDPQLPLPDPLPSPLLPVVPQNHVPIRLLRFPITIHPLSPRPPLPLPSEPQQPVTNPHGPEEGLGLVQLHFEALVLCGVVLSDSSHREQDRWLSGMRSRRTCLASGGWDMRDGLECDGVTGVVPVHVPCQLSVRRKGGKGAAGTGPWRAGWDLGVSRGRRQDDVVEQGSSDGDHGVFVGWKEVGDIEEFGVERRVLGGVVLFEGMGGGEFELALFHEAGVVYGIALELMVVESFGVLEGGVLGGVGGVAALAVTLEKTSGGHFDQWADIARCNEVLSGWVIAEETRLDL